MKKKTQESGETINKGVDFKVVIDFKEYPDIYNWMKKKAKNEFRTMEQQVMCGIAREQQVSIGAKEFGEKFEEAAQNG